MLDPQNHDRTVPGGLDPPSPLAPIDLPPDRCVTRAVRRVDPVPASPPTTLVPVLAPADEIDPALEQLLGALARAAQAGDRAARDLLFLALAPKIDRFVVGCRGLIRSADGPSRDGRAWDAEDLAQEAFLVFADLVAAWPGDGPVGPYLLAHFPWRLRSAWRAMAPPRRLETRLMAHHDLLEDGSATAEEARAHLEAIAAALSPPDGEILLRHIRDGERLGAIARRLGTDRRTVTRRWRSLREELRVALLADAPPPRPLEPACRKETDDAPARR